MSFRLHQAGQESLNSASERRSSGRVLQQGVVCSLGIVVDMSAGGMKVLCTRAQQGEVKVHIQSDSDMINVLAETAWSRKAGFRRHMVGLRFLDADQDTVRRLTAIALSHSLREAI